ncbi:MAG: mannose-1-phosphate guanylyltransferase/mannose-6-phosphate isomerase [Rhodospirillaceae bacterium]|nr:mannose-1-phosphate guanylyltransferase/mannose-6-phosphate isomerase [Rhodospirillaceae bacterium]
MPIVHPVILSGGSGSRLWPLSRALHPKQLIPLVSGRSLIQETVARVADPALYAPPMVVCGVEQRFQVAEQVRALEAAAADIVLEPMGRNTAPAVAVAALRTAERAGPDAVLALLPADHQVLDFAGFRRAMALAADLAAAGRLVTFGIVPDTPATGYGYIQRGEALGDGAYTVARFVEKPDLATAEAFLADGRFTWNGGMFIARADRLLDELARHAPGVLDGARAALADGHGDLDFFRLGDDAFAACPSISFDYAVMEKTDQAAVVEAAFGWSDVGAWSALWELSAHDGDDNAVFGDVLTHKTTRSYIRSDGMLTAVVGLSDVIVVTTADAILVASMADAQEVKEIVAALNAAGRTEAREHTRIYRPWGFYQTLHEGERFKVKRITVSPGQRLSLQRHYHRAEHWVVVNGTAVVTRDAEEILVRENEAVYLPLGCAHRLTNPGKVPLNLIEVQSGPYLEEDDIERLQDDYART